MYIYFKKLPQVILKGSQGWEARPPLVVAYSNLKCKWGYCVSNVRVNLLVLEELVKNADSGSFGFRRRSPGICISMQHLSPGPRTLAPGAWDHTEERGLGPTGARAPPSRRLRRGPRGVELIGVSAQTGWALDETRGDPSWHQVNDIQQRARKPPTSPRCLLSSIGELLKAGLCPQLARTWESRGGLG